MYQKKIVVGADSKGKPVYQEVFGNTMQEVEGKIQKLLQKKAKQAEA